MEGEYVRIDMVQQGEKLCGYSYDIVLANKKSHCTAYFEGKFNREKKYWMVAGKKFIENSGEHILMNVRIWNPLPNKKNVLRAAIVQESMLTYLLDNNVRDLFWLRKISDQPKSPGNGLPVCYLNPSDLKSSKQDPIFSVKKNDSVKASLKSVDRISSKKENSNNEEPNKLSSATTRIRTAQSEPEMPEAEPDPLYFTMMQRKPIVLSSIRVPKRSVQLKLYDNGTIDNDSVSIFYNGKLLQKNQRLTEDAILIDLMLDENVSIHEITLFAENLGAFPPNTATVVITSGKKRIELHSSASFENNSSIRMIYDPSDH
jgi:hypothetical protein